MKKHSGLLAILLFAGCGGSDAPPLPPASGTASTVKPGAQASDPKADPTQEVSVEAVADALLAEAGRQERAASGRPDLALAAHHEVCVRHPFTKAGRRAAARCVELETELLKAMDREFAGALTAAEELTKAGRFADAIASLKSFAASVEKDALKRRAERQAKRIENEARTAYVEAVRAARTSVSGGALDEAARLLKAGSEKSIPEVRDAAEKDLDLLDRYRSAEESKRSVAAEEAARRAFGDRAVRLLKRVREHAYAEVLKDLDAAMADPAMAPCKDRLTADRAAVAAASTFWDALQKCLKARVNQEVVFKMADGKSLRGTLKRIHETGSSVRVETVDVSLETLHPDQLLILGVNRDGLAEEAGASYAAAAMWFFLEGRHAESKVLLATADEMNVDVTVLENAWRRGFFRSASPK
jgi:hypothetical protein